MTNLHEHIKSTDSRVSRPDLYTAPAQPAAEDEVADFLASLVYLLKPEFVLEVGTAFGHTAEKIGRALQRNGFGHLDTIEMDAGRYEQARVRLDGLPVTQHLARFQDFQPPEGRRYRLCFFDADRRYRDDEYRRFAPWIDDNAALVFHDCGEQHPGMAGVQRLHDAEVITAIYLPTPRGICLATPRR